MVDHISTTAFRTADSIISILISRNAFILGGILAVSIYLLDFILSPRLDPKEPPLVKPSVPLIGHIIGVLWYQNDYHRIVQQKHPLPIASLQMLWGRMYTVWEPSLAQTVLRSRVPSPEPFFIDFASAVFGTAKETIQKIKDGNEHGLIPDFVDAIHGSMNTASVHRMNVTALNFVAETFNAVAEGPSGGLQHPNMYRWFRDIITIPTSRALLGKENPFDKDRSLCQTAWDWEENMSALILRPFPSVMARKPYQARAKIQAAMVDWYTAEHDINDPTVAQLVRDRARVLRSYGFTSAEIGEIESILPIIGVTNSAPTMFWMVCNIFSRPQLVDRLRDQIYAFIRREGSSGLEGSQDIAIMDVTALEAQCPLLASCFRETLRLGNFNVSTRRLMSDITVTDGTGNSYLLKKGVDIQIPAGIMHRMEDVWNNTASEFDPERFLEKSAQRGGQTVASEKAKRNAFIPFGGGRHLCPGRSFASTEISAIICTLLAGFEIEPVGLGFGDAKPGPPQLVTSLVKPLDDAQGLGIRLSRRKGWEKVQWRYEC
ncbi:cytochrome P450 [Coniochaeta ligniaria NRRL 30616]|uniref:Cytochrome P450 n=1 Tax=Coniochaeta ligniaria NRRL 30616 TaxID=1408157 RepID=A0A1J7JG31_9PEZI|nr:cytochrome P450 [Coniochaeta ligniaria NRRL 30616]